MISPSLASFGESVWSAQAPNRSRVVKLGQPAYFQRLAMSPFYHALNTGTLAAWLSVTGFGTVGVLLPAWRATLAPPPAPPAVLETQWLEPEIVLGEGDPALTEPPALPAADATPPEPLPTPPAMPQTAALAPLPEIPELPPPPHASPAAAKSAATAPRPQTRQAPATGRQLAANSRGASSATGSSGSSGVSQATRLAAGRMPSPTYPAEARRNGQTGTVTVEFTVDTSGRVIAAVAKSPSPWPLLNEEAVRTVRRWRFPPGGIMKLQRPIVFQLR